MSARDTAAPEVPTRAVSPVAALILTVWAASGVVLSLHEPWRGVFTFVFVLAGWVLSVMAHEFGHAVVAWLGGDRTVAEKGYLTLDPLRYMDSVTSLIIPLIVLAIGGIGFPGGAVYLRQDLMRGPLWRSASALAGPAATLVVLLALTGALAVLSAVVPEARALPAALAFLAFLQATALVLNLLPIPGLDGWGALKPFLPAALNARVRRVEGLVFVGFILLLFTSSVVSGELFGLAAGLTERLGAPRQAVLAGFAAFRFWD